VVDGDDLRMQCFATITSNFELVIFVHYTNVFLLRIGRTTTLRTHSICLNSWQKHGYYKNSESIRIFPIYFPRLDEINTENAKEKKVSMQLM
jgi:hypothetical protein